MQFSVSVASPAAQIVHKVLAQDKGDKSGSAKATWKEFILFLESFVFFSHFLDFSHSNTGTVLTAGNKFLKPW